MSWEEEATTSESTAEAEDFESRARAVWLQVQRESRKDAHERKEERLGKLVAETKDVLERLTGIGHRIEAAKAARQSWKHCTRYTVQASIWIQCELGRLGSQETSEAFADAFNRFLSRNGDSLDKGVFDTTNLETIVAYVETFSLPVDLFVPLVESPEQYLDKGTQDKLLSGQALNVKLVLAMLPVVKVRASGTGELGLDLNAKRDVRSLVFYALQFCLTPSWTWKPSWTNAELSELGGEILETLMYGSLGGAKEGDRVSAGALSAALARTFPTLHLLVVERYTKIMNKLEEEESLYLQVVEDPASAFQLTVLLHVLHWVMLGMSFRSFVDNDYSLSEAGARHPRC